MGWGRALERVGERGCELDLVGVWVLWVMDEEKKKKREMVNIVLLVIQCSCLWILGHQTGILYCNNVSVRDRGIEPASI